jgi:3,4-dihydroxy 2-butanone 4-phosphate synthase/GTP cyclohydrolase II
MTSGWQSLQYIIEMKLNSIQELITDIAQGKMVILMDDEDRENEGDLILAGEKVTSETVNFMATHARGLICLALDQNKCEDLGLEQMVKHNGTELGTAFTGSIEAATGVTTGISAADRATTILAAVKKNATSEDIVQPGHVFPIKAENGGVLTRAGHTEAGTDLAKLAGFGPSAVIVEIMNDDGTMARRNDLEIFAQKHDLKIGTIADLIHYRNISEKSVELLDKTSVVTEMGDFNLYAYRDTITNDVHLALVKGELSSQKEVIVRVQQTNVLHDIMGINQFGSRWSFSDAMKKINEEREGVLLLLSNKETSGEILNNINFLKDKKRKDSAETPDNRIIGVGSQILRDLGIKKIRLLGSSVKYPLTGFDLEITEFIN